MVKQYRITNATTSPEKLPNLRVWVNNGGVILVGNTGLRVRVARKDGQLCAAFCIGGTGGWSYMPLSQAFVWSVFGLVIRVRCIELENGEVSRFFIEFTSLRKSASLSILKYIAS